MSRTEHYAKPGAKPQVTPCDIREDLLRRDFTVNAIALGLNRSAKGLLVDPTNGLADLEGRELRTTNAGAFADRPVRMARLIRFKHRLQYSVAERTGRQLESALEAKLARFIFPADWFEELCACGNEAAPSAILREWEAVGILEPVGWNTAAVLKLEKLKASITFPGQGWRDGWGPLYLAMTEGASGREKAAMAKVFCVADESAASLKRLQTHARKLELAIVAPAIKRPGDLYRALRPFAPDEVLYALNCSTKRLVQDRIRTTLQKYMPLALEMGGAPEPEILAALNAKPKKPETDLAAAD
jgi:tRNA nucleotidyltransferase (CCA-adding enzyme)